MSVPAWVADAVFYQIFPDRFANGDASNDPRGVQPWGAPPTIWGFQGGDLRGVLEHLDYLADLGINALLFNPIFQASSNHRYNTTDYFRIDPGLGTQEDFRALLDAVHQRGMRMVLDGVFNHCGRGFFAFYDLLENELHSPYVDWFHVRRFPLHAYGAGEAENYLAWWKFKSLPKFNTGNPKVRQYLLSVAAHWVRQGIDGWRLDVPNEIDDDLFWAEFRETVKAHQSGGLPGGGDLGRRSALGEPRAFRWPAQLSPARADPGVCGQRRAEGRRLRTARSGAHRALRLGERICPLPSPGIARHRTPAHDVQGRRSACPARIRLPVLLPWRARHLLRRRDRDGGGQGSPVPGRLPLGPCPLG